jgi:hypothetical protein
MEPQPNNDDPHSPTEQQMVAVITMETRVMEALGFAIGDLPLDCAPIPPAVESLRPHAEA